MEADLVQSWSSVFTAIGTVAVAIAAIWGDWIRSKLMPARVTIEPHNLSGVAVQTAAGKGVVYFHLKAVNHRPRVAVRNVRVMLKDVLRATPNSGFAPVGLKAPLQFVWAPAESTPVSPTLVREQELDFGFIGEEAIFVPSLYSYTFGVPLSVGPDQRVRFCLEVRSDDYASVKCDVYEVYVPQEAGGRTLEEIQKVVQIRRIRE